MNERLDRFTKLLKEIFELDKSDLDFGTAIISALSILVTHPV